MKLFIIAGEASGDLHGGNLVKALKKLAPEISIEAWGGERMADEGAVLKKHYRELAFMGFWEVISNLRTISRNFKTCKAQIEAFSPDALVLIDYPGFNLRMAKWAKKKGIRVFYYISPQLWAWKEGRVKTVRRFVDRMVVILPFEKDFYAKHRIEVDFVGHPLLDEIGNEKTRSSAGTPVEGQVALLPGSRAQEVQVMLPIMLETATRFPDFSFVVCKAPSLDDAHYDRFDLPGNVAYVRGRTYDVLKESRAALVTSGTATLEAGLLEVPLVVCYKGNPFSYWVARRLVKVPFISLVNLIMEREAVRELIQKELTVQNLSEELSRLFKPEERESMLSDLRELKKRCGGTGASDRTARLLLKNMGSEPLS